MSSTQVNPPINSVTGIESLVLFGLQIFLQIFTAFTHPTAPVPTSVAPVLTAQLQSTPGLSEEHKTVIAAAVNAASTASSSGK